MDENTSKLLEQAALQSLGRLLTLVATTEADADAATAALEVAQQPTDESFFALVEAQVGQVSVGVWACYLYMLIANWGPNARDHAIALPWYRSEHPGEGDEDARTLLDHASQLLCSWAKLPLPGEEEDPDTLEEALDALHQLALLGEQRGHADVAYDLLAVALDLGWGIGDALEPIARDGLRLGVEAKQPHQAAACAVALVGIVVASAVSESSRRLEAFNRCEEAIERLRMCPEPFRRAQVHRLIECLLPHEFLRVLALPIFLLLPREEQPEELIKLAELPDWPARITTQSWHSAVQTLGQMKIQSWETEIENGRMVLEPVTTMYSAAADPTTWTVQHPAYRRAVPHSGSFLREQAFDKNVLLLTHEITHVFSLLGMLGAAFTCLRVANMDNEFTMWSTTVPPSTPRSQLSALFGQGPAPLGEGEPGHLLRCEFGAGLAAKSKALQDAWLPWLEGLAVFGETAADPSLDDTRINTVNEALRGLVDFHASNEETEEEMKARFLKHIGAFETRCHEAVLRQGPQRLSDYVRRTESVYLAGYLAVRMVVSTWRRTLGRPISAAQAFDLLLHATRFSTDRWIPDLSLPQEEFAQAATMGMVDWVSGLAELPEAHISLYLRPFDMSLKGVGYRWHGLELEAYESGEGPSEEQQQDWVQKRLRQAFSALARADALELAATNPTDLSAALREASLSSGQSLLGSEHWKSEFSRNCDLVQQYLNLGGLLPIGRADSMFYLVIDPDWPTAYLTTQMRTSEAAADTGNPSFNGLWFPVSHDAAAIISDQFQRQANPRIEVNRVIDLGGLVSDGTSLHLLTHRYGDWFAIRGATPVGDSALAEDEGRSAYLRDLLRRRLHPTPMERAVAESLFPDASVLRTKEWLSKTEAWFIDDLKVNLDAWVEALDGLATRWLDPAVRQRNQMNASRELLRALLSDDPQLAEDLVDIGFESLTSDVPEQRESIIAALFATARLPDADPRCDEINSSLSALGLRLLHRGAEGWDIRPASH